MFRHELGSRHAHRPDWVPCCGRPLAVGGQPSHVAQPSPCRRARASPVLQVLTFASSRAIMGEFANSTPVAVVAWAITLLVVAINFTAVYEVAFEAVVADPWVTGTALLVTVLLYMAFVAYLLAGPQSALPRWLGMAGGDGAGPPPREAPGGAAAAVQQDAGQKQAAEDVVVLTSELEDGQEQEHRGGSPVPGQGSHAAACHFNGGSSPRPSSAATAQQHQRANTRPAGPAPQSELEEPLLGLGQQ